MQHFPSYKKIYVLGGGESGIGAALLAQQRGCEVFLSEKAQLKSVDKKNLQRAGIAFEEGGHSINKALAYEAVIKSPGIMATHPVLQAAQRHRIPVIPEIQWAYYYKGESKIIGITGSNGKTTVSTLIHHILRESGVATALTGNVGRSFSRVLYEQQEKGEKSEVYVVELSSFQLEDVSHYACDIALILNISPDHLDRHQGEDQYIAAKLNLFRQQHSDAIRIYNADDATLVQSLNSISIIPKTFTFSMKKQPLKGAFLKEWTMTINTEDEPDYWDMDMRNLPFLGRQGKHSQYNTMASALASYAFGITKENIRQALSSFQGLAHRMELVSVVNDVSYVNDSKATNVHATWYALDSMQQPTLLILGGVDKGNDYSILHSLVKEKVKAIICLGVDNTKIMKAFASLVPVYDTHSLHDCMAQVGVLAKKGDMVLLSPACASFDLFDSYEDRGNQFKRSVNTLLN